MNRVATLQNQVDGNAGGVKVLRFSNPPQNTLNHATRIFLVEEIDAAEKDPNVKAIVLCSVGATFSAGAEITEFTESGMKEPYLPDVLDRIERCTKLVVSAVQGAAIGGGCELALASHARVASASAVFSLPEIRLGIIPGGGGTQRLPRAVGVQSAIEIACSGNNVKAVKAKAIGLIDTVTEGDVVKDAIAFALHFLSQGKKIRRLSEDSSKLGNCLTNAIIFRTARRKMVSALPSGMISPLRCLDAIQAATKARSFDEGMKMERKIFIECAMTPQAASLKHLFFATRAAAKPPIAVKAVDAIKTIGVIGGGTMGSGIAICFLKAGCAVTLLETSEERRKFCITSISSIFEASVAKKRMTLEKKSQLLNNLSVVVNTFEALSNCQYVIEAVFESMALKKEIFSKLDRVCSPECVLATNTSTLSVDEIASATSRPHMVIGAHFFSPANVMPLLEFVRGTATSKETVSISLELGKKIRKTCVVVGNCFGFVSNRMILRGGFQALAMLEEGCFPREIDSVIKRFGFPMGPFAMQDLAGLDVAAKIRLETPKEYIPARDVSTVAERLVKEGRFGQKSKKGWYLYPKSTRTPVNDFDVEKLIVRVSDAKKITRRHVSNDEILHRYLYAMINEAALILEQKFAARPSDVDVVFVFGFGFPFTKGGPCHYADTVGISKIVQTMQILNKALGSDTFPPPCNLLLQLAANGKNFASLN